MISEITFSEHFLLYTWTEAASKLIWHGDLQGNLKIREPFCLGFLEEKLGTKNILYGYTLYSIFTFKKYLDQIIEMLEILCL